MIRIWQPLNGMLSSLRPSTKLAGVPAYRWGEFLQWRPPNRSNPEDHAKTQDWRGGRSLAYPKNDLRRTVIAGATPRNSATASDPTEPTFVVHSFRIKLGLAPPDTAVTPANRTLMAPFGRRRICFAEGQGGGPG